MACNAWNHRPDCMCGWGGVNYGGITSTNAEFSWHEPDSFTRPNSHCPVCGVRVFFYRSPYGGSVYFDELGPPWPKHPCTDRSLNPIVHQSFDSVGKETGAESQVGWKHFPCITVLAHPRNASIVVFSSTLGTKNPSTLFIVGSPRIFDARTPFWVKSDRSRAGGYLISTLSHYQIQPEEMRLKAFDSIRALLEEHPGLRDSLSSSKPVASLATRSYGKGERIKAERVGSDMRVLKRLKPVPPWAVPVTVLKSRRDEGHEQQPRSAKTLSLPKKKLESAEKIGDQASTKSMTALEVAFAAAREKSSGDKK